MISNLTSVFLTGSTGFVGTNLISHLKKYNLKFNFYKKNSKIDIKEDIVIHLAGIAHDLDNKIDKSEYFTVNTDLTKKIFDSFLQSKAKVFIALSSIKAVTDSTSEIITEKHECLPISDYGQSKLYADEYITSKKIPKNKRIYILRPCMIYGPNNKGNLNLLYNFISSGFPWPLGKYHNKRSFCYIDNIIFVIINLIKNNKIKSGIYNVADDDPLSTNDIVLMIFNSLGSKPRIFNIPKFLIVFSVKFGDYFNLIFNTKNFNKLTESYVVSNKKLIKNIKKPLPTKSKTGMLKTFNTFN